MNDKIGSFKVVRYDLKTFVCCAQRRFGRIQTRKFRFVGCVDSGQLLAHKIRRLWFNMRCRLYQFAKDAVSHLKIK